MTFSTVLELGVLVVLAHWIAYLRAHVRYLRAVIAAHEQYRTRVEKGLCP